MTRTAFRNASESLGGTCVTLNPASRQVLRKGFEKNSSSALLKRHIICWILRIRRKSIHFFSEDSSTGGPLGVLGVLIWSLRTFRFVNRRHDVFTFCSYLWVCVTWTCTSIDESISWASSSEVVRWWFCWWFLFLCRHSIFFFKFFETLKNSTTQPKKRRWRRTLRWWLQKN